MGVTTAFMNNRLLAPSVRRIVSASMFLLLFVVFATAVTTSPVSVDNPVTNTLSVFNTVNHNDVFAFSSVVHGIDNNTNTYTDNNIHLDVSNPVSLTTIISAFTTFQQQYLQFVPPPAYAIVDRWSTQNAGTTIAINDIHFVDSDRGWATGQNGQILSTIDGGVTWIRQTVRDSNTRGLDLTSIHFTDSNNGWVVGDDGDIFHTRDGGDAWSAQDSDTGNDLRSVYFINDQTGWAVGNSGTVRATIDGGTTWSTQDSGSSVVIRDVYFINSQTGWAVGDSDFIIRTTDGGATWSDRDGGTNGPLNAVFFIDDKRGWAVGFQGVIVHSTDGGVNWSIQRQPFSTRETLNDVHFIDANTGWAVGRRGDISFTTNGGSNWRSQSSGINNSLNGISFVDRDTAWISGDSGRILYGSDRAAPTLDDNIPDLDLIAGTLTFNFDKPIDASLTNPLLIALYAWDDTFQLLLSGAILPGADYDIHTITFTEQQRQRITSLWYDADTGPLSVGFLTDNAIQDTNRNDFVGGGVLRPVALTDTPIANTWTTQTNIDNNRLLGAHFISNNIGWAVGDSGTAVTTINGGDTWSTKNVGTSVDLRDIRFAGTERGWAVGNSGVIRTTANGGDAWTGQSSGTSSHLADVYSTSDTRSWVVGASGTILATTDGGVNWTGQISNTSSDLRGVHFTTNTRGYAVGADGIILHTSDGGDNWLYHPDSGYAGPQTLNAIHFVDRDRGWIVGNTGTVLGTFDGGVTWRAQTVPDTGINLNDVQFTGPFTGWAVGSQGTVVSTVNGGSTWTAQDSGYDRSLFAVHVNTDRVWAVGDAGTIIHATHTDITPPLLRNDTPDINLLAGTLQLVFDETVNATTFTPASITVTDGSGVAANVVSLDGATASTANSSVITIQLTSAQRQDITSLLDDGTNVQLQVITTGALVSDIAGNAFAGISSTTPAILSVRDELHANDWVHRDIGGGNTLHLHDVDFINSTHGWAVGINGGLFATTDGGDDWNTVNHNINGGITGNLRAVEFGDSGRGYVVGDLGTIITTNDNGATWTRQTSGTNVNLFDVSFDESGSSVIAVGNNGTILFRGDNDTTWNTRTNPSGTDDLRSVQRLTHVNPGNSSDVTIRAWAVGNNGTILRSIDGGTTWLSSNSGVTTSSNLNAVHFTNIYHGFVVGAGGVYFTTDDGGVTWNPQNINVVGSTTLNDIYFTDTNNGWAVGGGGLIIYTSNGGLLWELADTESPNVTLRGIHLSDIGHGWAVGNGGTVLYDAPLDITVPTLDVTELNLDLNNGTIVLDFDEPVDVDTVALEQIRISDGSNNSNTNSFILTGATPSLNDSADILTITLTEPQRQQAISLLVDSIVTLQITVDETAISDSSDNYFIGLDTTLTITRDTSAPTLVDPALFTLDLGSTTNTGTLTLVFNEYIDISGIIRSGITITDSNGDNGINMVGTTIPADNTTNLVFTFTESQRQSLITLQQGPNNQLQIDISDTAIADTSTNRYLGVTNADLTVSADSTNPMLLVDGTTPNPVLDLGRTSNIGTLVFTFDEPVDVTAVSLPGITISDSTGTNTLTLDTTAALSDTNTDTLTITLTESQRQSLITILAGQDTSSLQLDVTGTAIADTSSNNYAGLTGTSITPTLDTTAPVLSTGTMPTLNLDTEMLTFVFDEIINVSAVTLAGITITDSTGANPVSLNGAGLPATNTDTLVISLTPLQWQDIIVLQAGANNTVQLNVNSTAINDTSSNSYTGLIAEVIIPIPDNTAPQLTNDTTTPNLDLGTSTNNGTVTFEFDEYIDVSAVILSDITITDSDGANGIDMTGSIPPTTDSATLTFTLTELDRQSLITLQAGANTPLQFNVAANTIPDIAGNAFAATTNEIPTVGTDGTPPVLDVDMPIPVYNLIAGTLTFDFDETINASAVLASGISVTDSTGTNTVTLTGATLPTSNSDMIRITVTAEQKIEIEGFDDGTETSLQVDVTNLAFQDTSVNYYLGVDDLQLDITRDIEPPTLVVSNPSLVLQTGILTFTFNEVVDASATDLAGITITDGAGENPVTLTGATLPTTDLVTLTITLTDLQRISVNELYLGDNPDLQVDVTNTAIHDLGINYYAGQNNIPLVITPDTDRPTLLPDAITPNLNLDSGTLTFDFNEYIDVSALDLSGISITDSLAQNPVRLTGSTPPTTDSASITITLTESQRQSIVILHAGDNSPVRINVIATAIADIAGNTFAGLDNASLDVIDDTTAPTLTDRTLDLGSTYNTGTLTLTFNEYIDVSAVILAGISISDGTDINTVTLDTTSTLTPDTDTNVLTITLSEPQRQSVIALQTGAGTTLQIDIAGTAISDVAGISFIGLVDGSLTVINDVTAPALTTPAPTLDLGTITNTGTLTLTFNEYIDVSTVKVEEITITDSNGANSVDLTNATPATPTDSATLTINLTSSQRQSLVILQAGTNTPLQLDITNTAIADTTTAGLGPNNYAGLDNGSLTVTADNTAPTLTVPSPVLDLGGTTNTGTLTFTFDEYVVISADNLAGITITNSAGENGISLTGARLPSSTLADSNTITLTLTESQRQSMITLAANDNTSLRIDVTSNTIFDIAGNTFARLTTSTLSVTPDSTPPELDVLTPNYNTVTGILSFDFNETIDVSATNFTEITITDSNGANSVDLTGTTPSSVDSDVLTITLTASQQGLVASIVDDNVNTTLRVNVTATAIKDTSTNAFAGINTELSVTTDATPPILLDGTVPHLDLNAMTLTLQFNEPVNITNTTMTDITITDSNNQNPVSLFNATFQASNTDTPVINLTTKQWQEIIILQTGSNNPVQINIQPNVIRDTSTNEYAGLINGTLLITPDGTAPTLTDSIIPTLDLDAGTLLFTFNEFIAVSATVLAGISITDSTGANPITLAGADTSTADSVTLTIILTESQRQYAVELNTGANNPVRINVADTAISDLTGNAFAGLSGFTLDIVDDGTPPKLTDDTPTLDLRTGSLTLQFNETVNVPATSSKGIIITAGTDTVSLTDATFPTSNSATFTITPTPAQLLSITDLISNNGADSLQITISSSTVSDLTGNFFVGINNAPLDVITVSSGGGGGGGSSSSTPPSFTTSFGDGERTIMINNVEIAPEPFRTDYTQDQPSRVPVGTPVPFSFTMYDDESWENIIHFEICLNKPVPNNLICDGDTKIIWDKYTNDGVLELVDPNSLINTATLNIAHTGTNIATFDFELVFDGALSSQDIQIYTWDVKRNAVSFTIRNTLVVTAANADTNPNTDTSVNDNTQDTTTVPTPINVESCAPGKLQLADGTCMDPEPGTFVCGSDQIMLDDTTCKNITTTAPPATDQSISLQTNQKQVVSMWAGYDTAAATDMQILEAFNMEKTGTTTITLPTWLKSSLGSWTAQDKVSIQEFKSALRYLVDTQNGS